ncbi:FAD-dependent oxidoreductase [Eubacteriales bacterium DFI.9.88]|nr:FAD-dependent oxidoreductase [Eubacteriales bacterium DFI.9.88]
MYYSELFTPTNIGTVTIKNKLSMAPMGPVGYADENGAFSQRLQDYYVERARGGIGLIITGLCNVDLETEKIDRSRLPSPTFSPTAFIHAGNQMNDRIHAHDTKCFIQLTGGMGRSAMPGRVGKYIAPSKNTNRFDPMIEHREMTAEEIQKLIQKFVEAAVISKQSGFDGIEIHAVHEGYLLDQFAIALFNQRTDEYGGSLENRLRLATDIVRDIKKACGSDYPVSLRYSLKSMMKGLRQGALPGESFKEAGRDIDEGIEAAKILVEAGYDALNVDAGTYDSWYWNHPPVYFEDGMYREFGKLVKQHVDTTVILAGRMENPNLAVEALTNCCDIIGIGRQLLADAWYPEKVRTGKLDEIRPCLGCHEGCLGHISKGPICCAVNPACGREKIYGLVPINRKKSFAIIGGGVAGMESARVLAERGHSVTLYEKNDKLGGNLIPGSVPHFKRFDKRLIEWYEVQLKILNVDIKLNKEVSKEDLASLKVGGVIAATGSTPIKHNFGSVKDIPTADEVLLGKVDVGKKVIIIGGGLVGCETGLWLSQKGFQVTIVEMLSGRLHNLPHMNYFMLEDMLKHNKVSVMENTKVLSVDFNKVTVESEGEVKELESDTVISAIGYRENDNLYHSIKELDIPVYHVGDSRKVHNIMYAIWDAYEIAREL